MTEPRLYRRTKWLEFLIVESKPKTVVVAVRNTSGQHLGEIRWYGAWRQYTFSPTQEAPLVFNNRCLEDIVNVINSLNAERTLARLEAQGLGGV